MGLTKSTQIFVQKMIDASQGIPITDFGCIPNNPAIDNGMLIMKGTRGISGMIDLYIPEGRWFSNTCIESIDKVINLTGAGRDVTQWRMGNGRAAYFIYQPTVPGLPKVRLSGIEFQCDKYADVKEGEKTKDLAGLRIYHECLIEECNIVGFTGGGLQMYGELNTGMFLNVSGSVVKNCKIANIKGDGVWIVGPDANACLFESLDIRDCTGIAVNDHSFLGCTWKAIMTHNNERSFHVENITARSSFIGCYHESGQKLPALGNIETGQYKELPYFEGMFTWDLGATSLK